ncbi:DUF4191 domain-containing protein [Demequina sp. B12]|uniref:DUF4191 family protein n=1 Tax=Demequina sp. B12 TaxID=2992757 RepID=UPI00237BF6F2|nr:DUF4191 family protein [Demequina sp. B12]MDE0572934.1 DUF4191 domain-containing protein [Demequina sp. B12]
MAKEPEKKPKMRHLIKQAYTSTAPDDKWLLPLLILIPLGIIGVGLAIGLISGSTWVLVYSLILAIPLALLAGMYTLTRRFERNAYIRMEGQPGAAVAIAQSIRRGWLFQEQPMSVDPRGKGIVFYGVGKGGVVLLAEGGNSAKKQVEAATRRITKLVPGVPVDAIYVGPNEGQVPLKKLNSTIKKRKKALNKHQREQVIGRLRAIGGQKLPVPKGVDPMRARPDRKAMRGR